MNKVTLYSRSIRTRKAADAEAATEAAAPASPKARAAVGAFFRRHERALWTTACALLAAALYFGRPLLAPPHKELTQEDIDAAVLHTLETKPLPSRARQGATRRSSRRWCACAACDDDEREDGDAIEGVGHGRGHRRQRHHPHQPARRRRRQAITVDVLRRPRVRRDGRSACSPRTISPSCRRRSVPDDLEPATLRSTGDLAPGDEVVAVGFPFGIGPSVVGRRRLRA